MPPLPCAAKLLPLHLAAASMAPAVVQSSPPAAVTIAGCWRRALGGCGSNPVPPAGLSTAGTTAGLLAQGTGQSQQRPRPPLRPAPLAAGMMPLSNAAALPSPLCAWPPGKALMGVTEPPWAAAASPSPPLCAWPPARSTAKGCAGDAWRSHGRCLCPPCPAQPPGLVQEQRGALGQRMAGACPPRSACSSSMALRSGIFMAGEWHGLALKWYFCLSQLYLTGTSKCSWTATPSAPMY
eukprot:CAMPEP_0202885730 /NCGR_PEP_ID=MMETSP1391-20130828/41815_1 /ASSEMBLY_ACC=CAM_ASM_000867 /TAXON_ID=1034604 /ORGANISM="Chlamydomonas leiostraca, Strain SAG 11-49" /LENGTH=237 /DNA_ID=CAMNT_0049568985 /DNA_START=15 /DNA_END=726 /DNA_ORIENTATION=+